MQAGCLRLLSNVGIADRGFQEFHDRWRGYCRALRAAGIEPMDPGAVMAAAADVRVAADTAKIAFLFTKVGLSGADMGACALLPR